MEVHEKDMFHVSFLERGMIVSSGRDRKVKLWNLGTGSKNVLTLKSYHLVRAVAISAECNTLLSGEMRD